LIEQNQGKLYKIAIDFGNRKTHAETGCVNAPLIMNYWIMFSFSSKGTNINYLDVKVTKLETKQNSVLIVTGLFSKIIWTRIVKTYDQKW